MNTFDDRKKGFEAKYMQDQDTQFKVRALWNKFVGKWAASLVKPENEEDYIKEVRTSDLEKPGDDDIIDKLLSDFNSKNIDGSRDEIIKKINDCEGLAIDELSKT